MNNIETPAYIINEGVLSESLEAHNKLCSSSKAKLFYSVKANFMEAILEKISNKVDGFSVSSVFEAQISKSVSPKEMPIHIIKPSYTESEIKDINKLCSSITFNSLEQLERLSGLLNENIEIGLRINPESSLVKNPKYNPCREFSKLGVPLKQIKKISDKLNISGIHFHNNCEGICFEGLKDTVKEIERNAPSLLEEMDWINLGGGYFLDQIQNDTVFTETVGYLRKRYDLSVIYEPGGAIVRNAVELVSKVTDIIERDNKKIAILDTSINHTPEVFEYQYEPDVFGHNKGYRHNYILAGSSCLAGDIFGEYSFNEVLELNSLIKIKNMGCYTFVKANFFNGINLPSIYMCDDDNNLKRIKSFKYKDFYNIARTDK